MPILFSSSCEADTLEVKALAELRYTLETKNEFVKGHAAEYLIWVGYKEEARRVFLHENQDRPTRHPGRDARKRYGTSYGNS